MLPLESAHCFLKVRMMLSGRQRTRFGPDLQIWQRNFIFLTAAHLVPKHTGLEALPRARYINVWSSVSLCSLKGLNKHTLLAARPSRLHYMQKQEMFLKHREREGSLDCVPHVVLYLRVILKPLWTWKQDQKRSKPASFSRIPRLCSAPFDP